MSLCGTVLHVYLYSIGGRDIEPPFRASVGGGGNGTCWW